MLHPPKFPLLLQKAIPLLLLLPFLGMGCSSLDPNEALTIFKEGNEHYFNFDFVGAQQRYEKALELNPDLPMVRNNLACAKFRQEQFELCIDDLDVVASDFPKFAKSLYNRGLVYSYLGQYDVAIENLDAAIAIYQAELDTNQMFCCLQPKNKDNPCCVEVWEKYLAEIQAVDSCYEDFCFNPQCANRYCCKQAELPRDPENASREEKYEAKTSANYYGKKVGRLNTPATDSLDFRTLWLEHALAYAHMKRGLFRQKLRSYKGAISDYDRSLELNGPLLNDDSLKTGELYLNRGNCYQALAIQENGDDGDSLYRKAIQDYITAIANPEDTAINWEARYQMAVCSLGLRASLDSVANIMFKGIIEQQPGDPRPHTKRANCLQALGLIDDAIGGYSESLELDPNQPDAVFNRGNCFIAKGLPSLAIADFTACVGLMPDYANSWYMRGITRMKLGDVEGAKGDLNTAGEKGHPAAFMMLGKLEKLERKEDKNAEQGEKSK